jgi:hypothetical protein
VKTVLDTLRAESSVIRQTFWSFIIVVVVVCGSVIGIGIAVIRTEYEWRYRSQIEAKDSVIQEQKADIEHWKSLVERKDPTTKRDTELTSRQRASMLEALRGTHGKADVFFLWQSPNLEPLADGIADVLKRSGWNVGRVGASITVRQQSKGIILTTKSAGTPYLRELVRAFQASGIDPLVQVYPQAPEAEKIMILVCEQDN